MALYKTLEGVSVFTGLVVPPGGDITKTRRLDDHKGPLDGPGHQVDPGEFAAHVSMYDDSTFPRVQTPLEGLLDMEDANNVAAHSYGEYEPGTVFAPAKRRPDGSVDAQLRAGDSVQVVLEGIVEPSCGCRVPARERFWCLVYAVLPHGEVVAVPKSTLNWFDVGPDVGPVFFPATRVLAQTKGCYW